MMESMSTYVSTWFFRATGQLLPAFISSSLEAETFYELPFEICDSHALWKQTDYGVIFIEDIELLQNEMSSKIPLTYGVH